MVGSCNRVKMLRLSFAMFLTFTLLLSFYLTSPHLTSPFLRPFKFNVDHANWGLHFPHPPPQLHKEFPFFGDWRAGMFEGGTHIFWWRSSIFNVDVSFFIKDKGSYYRSLRSSLPFARRLAADKVVPSRFDLLAELFACEIPARWR